MLNETRVNLKRLLEDIRDSYTSPLEEVIITELVANALDSKATRIEFVIDQKAGFLRCLDNGQGMKRLQLKEYHNIATTTKLRGAGIGFDGVGAKLALILAEKVVTESKGGYGSKAATEWRLTNPYRAQWKFIPSTDIVQTPRGTAVTIFFSDNQTHLLQENFVRKTVVKHFYPLLHNRLHEEILRFVYKKGIEFIVSGELLVLPDDEQRVDQFFKIFLGKSRRPIGAGFLTKKVLDQSWIQKLTGKKLPGNSLPVGISIATYGKIIKSGWEWLGILPKSHQLLSGLVEIPALSALLTTNKNDFLSDSTHLKQYYKFRKAIQQAILPVLKELGEYPEDEKKPADRNIKTLTKQIEDALLNVTDDFPELASLLGPKRKITGAGQLLANEKLERAGAVESTKKAADPYLEEATPKKEKDKEIKSKFKKAGLQIFLEELRDEPQILGRMVEDIIYVNTLHPAWRKALRQNCEEYHIVLTAGLVLSEFLDPEKHPQEFLGRLLSSWGDIEDKRNRLF